MIKVPRLPVSRCIVSLNQLIWNYQIVPLDKLILCMSLRTHEGSDAQVRLDPGLFSQRHLLKNYCRGIGIHLCRSLLRKIVETDLMLWLLLSVMTGSKAKFTKWLMQQILVPTRYQGCLLAGLNNSRPALHFLYKSQSMMLLGIN